MSNKDEFNIDYIINNTQILTEFTSLAKRIQEIVSKLPDDDKYDNLKENTEKILEDISELILLFKTNKDIPVIKSKLVSVETKIDSISKETINTNNYIKFKLPLIVGFFQLVLIGIGWYFKLY